MSLARVLDHKSGVLLPLTEAPEALQHAQETSPSLLNLYNEMFESVRANNEALIDECYRLRYKVYCVEHPFEDPNPELGEYERDEYDGHSVHALLKHRKSGEHIGSVRLIIDQKDTPQRIPAIRLAEEHGIVLPRHLYNQPCAEASRFCISKEFRRRITDSAHASSYTSHELVAMRNRVIPFMALGLMKMVFAMCKEHSIRQCCAVMEPSLLRLLDKLGIRFEPVGGLIEHHGLRQICFITNCNLYETLLSERPDVLDMMTEGGRSPLIY